MDDQMNQAGAGPGEAERAQGFGAVAPGRGGRISRQRKTAAVLRLLRGEDLETVSRELGVTAATLTGWRDAFLAGGEAALMTRAATGEELESERPTSAAMCVERISRCRATTRTISTFPRSTVDWDTSQADDFRTRGVSWTTK